MADSVEQRAMRRVCILITFLDSSLTFKYNHGRLKEPRGAARLLPHLWTVWHVALSPKPFSMFSVTCKMLTVNLDINILAAPVLNRVTCKPKLPCCRKVCRAANLPRVWGTEICVEGCRGCVCVNSIFNSTNVSSMAMSLPQVGKSLAFQSLSVKSP